MRGMRTITKMVELCRAARMREIPNRGIDKAMRFQPCRMEKLLRSGRLIWSSLLSMCRFREYISMLPENVIKRMLASMGTRRRTIIAAEIAVEKKIAKNRLE